MTFTRVTRNIALVSGAGLAIAPMAFAAAPSFAATDCGEGTEVATGICEKAFTAAGDYTFAVPSSVSKMSAVLVGGGEGGGILADGGGPFGAYAGSGGGVLFVDSVSLSGPIAITVGAGGDTDFSDGGDTTVGSDLAGGGKYDNVLGPVSGYPQQFPAFEVETGPPLSMYSGAGAGGTPSDCSSGPGLTASAAATGSSLFPAVAGEPSYGVGGSCSGVVLTGIAAAGRGGDVYSDGPNLASDAGVDGAVILRWTPDLPDTGLSVQPWVIGASVAAVLGGAVLASGALRVRRQGRHSN